MQEYPGNSSASPGDRYTIPFFFSETYFPLIVTAEWILFKVSYWVQWALNRGHTVSSSCGLKRTKHLLTVTLQIAVFRCCAAHELSERTRHRQHPHSSPPAGFILGAFPWGSCCLFPRIHFQFWIKSAELTSLICVCPRCRRQIRSKIPAGLLLLALGSSVGWKALRDSSCLSLGSPV